MRYYNYKKAFTLAEIMIVFGVIGILTAILLPAALHSSPDENVMKFKKANATLMNVITKLVRSDQYYKDGNLSLKPDGSKVTSPTYLCETIADIITPQTISCSSHEADYWSGFVILTENNSNIQEAKERFDIDCKANTGAGEEIVISNNIAFYQVNPAQHFGINVRINGDPDQETSEALFLSTCPEGVSSGCSKDFLRIYKLFCIDIDGIPSNGSENCDDVDDICPFGYGIRADGRILPGARAEEWMQKSVTKN